LLLVNSFLFIQKEDSPFISCAISAIVWFESKDTRQWQYCEYPFTASIKTPVFATFSLMCFHTFDRFSGVSKNEYEF